MTRTLLALLLVLGQLPLAAAPRRRAVQHPSAPVAPSAIVTAARQVAETTLAAGIPAVQIAVSHRGRVIYSEAFGVTDQESATAATPGSVLRIGSITKQFTAAAILRLAERGALSLDDRIEKFVPDFDPRGRTITLRHLLTHTAGVAAQQGLVPESPITREQVMANLNGQAFNFTPGSMWSYSNAGYLLLGYAIESITGSSYADFIQSEFVLPLGLIHTGMCGTSNLPLPVGYGLFNGTSSKMPSFHTSVLFSSGSLCSTASDLARWSHLLATGRATLPSSYETMTTPARLANNAVVANNYAFGVYAQTVLGHPAVFHGGTVNGFNSFLLYFSNQEIAVAVITNAFPNPPAGNPQLIAMAVAEAALGAL